VVGAVRLASGQPVTAALCLSDPGAVVKRDMAWKPPRWDGDTPEAEPLLLWQERALRAAGLLREPEDAEIDRDEAVKALRYVASPTMGWPGSGHPARFAMHGATEHNARYALSIVINMARRVLGTAEAYDATPPERVHAVYEVFGDGTDTRWRVRGPDGDWGPLTEQQANDLARTKDWEAAHA
jgi:hypothetical protein